jgi:hypothetical protein
VSGARCLHCYAGPAGPECRGNPPQVVACEWTGKECGQLDIAKASPSEFQDRKNWQIISVFPEAIIAAITCMRSSRHAATVISLQGARCRRAAARASQPQQAAEAGELGQRQLGPLDSLPRPSRGRLIFGPPRSAGGSEWRHIHRRRQGTLPGNECGLLWNGS